MRLLLALLLVLAPTLAAADETSSEALAQGLSYAADCTTTAVNTGLGAGEANALPRAFHNNTSLVNCALFYAPWVMLTELLRHAPFWRRLEFGLAESQEAAALINNVQVTHYALGHGTTFWQYAPLGGFFRLRL